MLSNMQSQCICSDSIHSLSWCRVQPSVTKESQQQLEISEDNIRDLQSQKVSGVEGGGGGGWRMFVLFPTVPPTM